MIWTLARRNALRNRRRSALTIVTVMLGSALLVIGLAWINGLFGSMIDKQIQQHGHLSIRTNQYAKQEHAFPLAEHLLNVSHAAAQLEALDGIDTVHPIIRQPATLEVNNQIGDVFSLTVGADTSYFDAQLNLRNRLVRGRFFKENSTPEECLIGIRLAQELQVELGDIVYFTGVDAFGGISAQKVSVVGIVDTGNGIFDRQMYLQLDQLQAFADLPNGATELLVFGDPYKISNIIDKSDLDLHGLTDSYHEDGSKIPLALTPWHARQPFASTLVILRFILIALSSMIVFVTALGILNTMMMSVMERTGEIGVLRAIGMPRYKVGGMIVMESIVIALVGGILGAVIGALTAIGMGTMGVNLGEAAAALPEALPLNTIIRPQYEISMSYVAIGLSVCMAAIGAFIPMIIALKRKPVDAISKGIR